MCCGQTKDSSLEDLQKALEKAESEQRALFAEGKSHQVIFQVQQTWDKIGHLKALIQLKRAEHGAVSEVEQVEDNALKPEPAPPTLAPAATARANVDESDVRAKVSDQERASQRRLAVVRPLLEKKSWTKNKWASQAGVSKNSVYDYLQGKRRLSTANESALAEELGVEKLPE